MKKITSGLLLTLIAAGALAGCSNVQEATTEEPPETTAASTTTEPEETTTATEEPETSETTEEPDKLPQETLVDNKFEEHAEDYRGFALKLASECASATDENVLVSPASALFALEMTAAGAANMTLDEIAQAIIPNATPEQIQNFTVQYMDSFDGDYFSLANAIWIDDAYADAIYDDYKSFLSTYYGAEISYGELADATQAINDWVKEKTKGRIPALLEDGDLGPSTVQVLVNAITFDATWYAEFPEDAICTDKFNNYGGSTSDVTYMNGFAEIYFEAANAEGFIKYYDNDDYMFMAILPDDESISANDYLASLTAEDFDEIINSRNYSGANVKMPEFKSDYRTELNSVLTAMGIEQAFDHENADFSAEGDFAPGAISISKVVQQATITVDRKGTEAAAATAVMEVDSCEPEEPEEVNSIELTRPFVYIILDTETRTPIFTGTINNM